MLRLIPLPKYFSIIFLEASSNFEAGLIGSEVFDSFFWVDGGHRYSYAINAFCTQGFLIATKLARAGTGLLGFCSTSGTCRARDPKSKLVRQRFSRCSSYSILQTQSDRFLLQTGGRYRNGYHKS
ncbi:unnamed protein product [Pieris macdunnoughi]|uniref:Uncharacterized protein n=1 Tax=Pieris macdunnoughi TaxID=345717 RepID=A0A821WKP4_9NEOP|nr:unnamed protein product [Pieris macdunnoughi]